jgi:serine/threonine protein kinase
MEEESIEKINLELEDNFKINDTYTILLNRKIGSGSFGQIYQCLNIKTKEIYACKIESINELNPQLYHESKIMNIMKNCDGFPTCYSFCYTEQDKVIIMDYLGANLDTIMNKLPNKKYTIKTSLMIMIQCLERLRNLHEKGIIHRDMKPENFVIGRKNKERTIYLIDFGLSRKYINENNIHISMKKDRNIIGTVRYISMNTHQGIEQSRRDDLESLIYIIIYFIKGELPWQNIKAKNKTERYNKIYEMKKKSTEKGGELCSSLPNGFQTIIDYVLELEFTEKPDYSMLKKVVEIILAHNNYFNDLQFDWYNLDFLKNLYKSPLVTDNNNNNKSSNNDNKENENKGIVKENNKEINNDNDKINKNKKEIKNNINGKKSDINNANKNNVHHNYFKRNQSISKTKNSTTISESKNNKYKSPALIKNSTLHKNSIQDNTEIKTVKTFLQGNNRTKQWNDILNIKDNSSIKFMKSKNNISHIYKK